MGNSRIEKVRINKGKGTVDITDEEVRQSFASIDLNDGGAEMERQIKAALGNRKHTDGSINMQDFNDRDDEPEFDNQSRSDMSSALGMEPLEKSKQNKDINKTSDHGMMIRSVIDEESSQDFDRDSEQTISVASVFHR